MITPSANFQTAAANINKLPVIVIDIDGLQYGGNDVYFATGDFGDIDSEYQKLLTLNMSADLYRMDLLRGNLEVGSYQFEIVDGDDMVFTDVLNNYSLDNRSVTIKIGFQSIDIADFYSLPVGYISDVQLNADLMTYTVTADIPFFNAFVDVFRVPGRTVLAAEDSGEAVLSSGTVTVSTSAMDADAKVLLELKTQSGTPTQPIAVTAFTDGTDFTLTAGGSDNSTYYWAIGNVKERQTTINVEGTSKFLALGEFSGQATDSGFLKIKNEVVAYTGTTSTTFTGLARGFSNTTAVEYDIGEPIDEVYFFNTRLWRSPGENLLRLLTTSAAGTNGNYDEGIENFGAEIDSDLIDSDSITRKFTEQYVAGPQSGFLSLNTIFRFYFEGTQSLHDLVFNTWFKIAAPVIPFINSDGKIDVSFPDPCIDSTVVDTITEDKIISISARIMENELVNRIRINFNGQPGWYFKNLEGKIIKNNESVTAFGSKPVLDINYPPGSVPWDNDSSTFYLKILKALTWRTLALFGQKNVEFEVETEWGEQFYEVGDYVGLTHSKVPDWINNDRGISALPCYVIGKRFNLTGTVNYTLKSFEAFTINPDPIDERTTVTPDDTTVTKSADTSVTIEAADGYYDNTSAGIEGQFWLYSIQITPPGTATTGIDYALVQLSSITSAAFDFNPIVQIAYEPSSSTAFTVQIKVYHDSNIVPDTLKVDYTGNDSGTGADEPTVAFTSLTAVKTAITLSEET